MILFRGLDFFPMVFGARLLDEKVNLNGWYLLKYREDLALIAVKILVGRGSANKIVTDSRK